MSQQTWNQTYKQPEGMQLQDLESSSSSSDEDGQFAQAENGSTSFQRNELYRLIAAGSILFCVLLVGGVCAFKVYDAHPTARPTSTLTDPRRKLINPSSDGEQPVGHERSASLSQNLSQNYTKEDSVHDDVADKFEPTMWKGVAKQHHPTPSAGCADSEELFAHLCYKKCSLLTDGRFPHRRTSNACGRDADADGPAEVSVDGLFCEGYQVAAGGQCPHPPFSGECDANEELHLGKCYKKCTILTDGEYSIRSASNTCCKQKPCFNPFHLKTRGLGCRGFGVGGGLSGHECPHEPSTEQASEAAPAQSFAHAVLK